MNEKLKIWSTSIFLILILSITIFITGCSGFSSSGSNGKCDEGDNCRFYTGSRGIIMLQDRPQTTMYYRSADMGKPEGNLVNFNVRLRNDGASDSYGAVFLSGFSPALFSITDLSTLGQPKPLMVGNSNPCHFNFLGASGNNVGNWNFQVGCIGGSSYGQYGGAHNLVLGPDFFSAIAKKIGWSSTVITSAGVTWKDGQILGLGINGLNTGQGNVGTPGGKLQNELLNHGRALVLMTSSLNLAGWGGSEYLMKGDNAVTPGGDVHYKVFQVQMISPWPTGQDYYKVPYKITSCYEYTTFVSPLICVDPSPFSESKKTCNAATYTWGGSQGAPVAVTKVQETNTGNQVILDITIKNVGPGKVWDVGYLESCSPYYPGGAPNPNMYNVVYVGYAYIDNRPIDCSSNYMVRLDPKTKDARITCKYDTTWLKDYGLFSEYVTPLRMELWYGYEETITNQITIRRLS